MRPGSAPPRPVVAGADRVQLAARALAGEDVGGGGGAAVALARPSSAGAAVDIYRARQPAGSGNPKAAGGRHAGPSEVRPGSKVRRTNTPSTVCLPVR